MNKKVYIVAAAIAGVLALMALGMIEKEQAQAVIGFLLGAF